MTVAQPARSRPLPHVTPVSSLHSGSRGQKLPGLGAPIWIHPFHGGQLSSLSPSAMCSPAYLWRVTRRCGHSWPQQLAAESLRITLWSLHAGSSHGMLTR